MTTSPTDLVADPELPELMKKAEELGIDQNHLVWLLREVTAGRYTDFYQIDGYDNDGNPIFHTDPIECRRETYKTWRGTEIELETPIYANLSQVDAPRKHCVVHRVKE